MNKTKIQKDVDFLIALLLSYCTKKVMAFHLLQHKKNLNLIQELINKALSLIDLNLYIYQLIHTSANQPKNTISSSKTPSLEKPPLLIQLKYIALQPASPCRDRSTPQLEPTLLCSSRSPSLICHHHCSSGTSSDSCPMLGCMPAGSFVSSCTRCLAWRGVLWRRKTRLRLLSS